LFDWAFPDEIFKVCWLIKQTWLKKRQKKYINMLVTDVRQDGTRTLLSE
jgi:hypothetical protein